MVASVGSGQVDLANENSNSSAANRIINGVTGTISLAAGAGVVELVYDGSSSRWRVVDHEQGAWITPAFSAGDYTGLGSMTWTVDAGDVTTCAYRLKGRSLSIMFQILTTSVGGTPSAQLQRAIPGGFTNTKTVSVPCYVDDALTVATGRVGAVASATVLNFRKDMVGSGNWATSTNQTGVVGEITIEVQ